jgi:hypothetical protein
MTDHPPDLAVVRAMLAAFARGPEGPTIAQMRRDPLLAADLRSEEEMRPLCGEMFKIARKTPPQQCLAPTVPLCSKRPISSHSIQRNGPVQHLADATNHVVMLSTHLQLDEPPITRARRVGINDATTFPGLCAEHDTSLFLPIDTQSLVAPTPEQLFLLSYRAVLRELYAKRVQLHRAKELARLVSSDTGASMEIQVAAMAHAYHVYVGTFHIEQAKREYDARWTAKAYEHRLRFLHRRTRPLPFAVSSFFTPTFDLDVRPISRGGARVALPAMTLDVVPDASGTLVSLAVPSQHEAALAAFVEALTKTSSEEEFVAWLWEITLRYCENLVIAPSAWQALTEPNQQRIEEFFFATGYSKWQPWPGVTLSIA